MMIAMSGQAFSEGLEMSNELTTRFIDVVNGHLFEDIDLWKMGTSSEAMETIFNIANTLSLPEGPFNPAMAYKKRSAMAALCVYWIPTNNFAYTMAVNPKFRDFLLNGARF